ncbi:helix-turn-helix transcriptional regulator [Chitinophaga vietnamensis]|uniref:helix-turn-helix transcriptional regulator n=1 Tax=Chitinophaga vietnamensis TaxID=2593957 RepID=UPI00117829EA|nr:helix-turn-helix transcriptional regulator [Chitinophaga vietnamensis]
MPFLPSAILAPYIKNYTVLTIGKDLNNEVFYPSAYVDMVVNLSGSAATIINGNRKDTPSIELLGHLTLPTRLSVSKGTTVLIARFFPYACPLFFPHPVAVFTNYATDLYDVEPAAMQQLYEQLQQAPLITGKIAVLETYLLQQLRKNEKQLKKAGIVQQLCRQLSATHEQLNLPALARSSGISERYIQQLYLSHVGISPAAFVAVIRFNKSLDRVLSTPASLTSIAYECGYYDQAHFIKEFRKFTGITPSAARLSLMKHGEAFQQAVNIGF